MSTSKCILILLSAVLAWLNVSFVQASADSFANPNPQQVNQNQKNISGTITDVKGEAIIGANIRVKGTTVGTITDFNGQFSLAVPQEGILEISYIGYVAQEVNLANKNIFNIRLEEDSKQLEEIVVVGYGTQKKVNLTGSVSSVKMEEIMGNRPVANITSALMGTLPGLVLSGKSGEPGSSYDIKVRGTSSINGGNPLILVDNVPMDIADINPEDIESISVLKDASAAAVYGARAAFGVILVTTKKSEKEQQNRFNYSSKISLNNPQEMLKRATPLQTIQGVRDAGYVTVWTGQDVTTWLDLLGQYGTNPSQFPEGFGIVDGVRYSLKGTDLTKDLIDNFGVQQIHDFSVSGGSAKSSYRVSLGLLDEDGILVTNKDSYRRYNVSSFLSMDATKWLTAQLSLLYSNSEKKDPFISTFMRDVWSQSVYAPSFYPTDGMEIDGEYYPFGTPRHVLEVITPDTKKTNRINLTGRLLAKPFEGFTLTGEYSINRYFESYNEYEKPINNFADGMAFNKVASSITQSSYKETKKQSNYDALNVFASYNKRFENHEFTLTGGINSEYSYYEDIWAARLQMINDELPSIGQGVGLITAGDDFKEYAIFGTFYRLNYSFKDKYLFEASGRYDGSSKFPENNRFGFFPSFSAGWRISEEGFMKDINSYISNLKLRGSWGSIGNQDINPYSFNPGMEAYLIDWLVGGQKATSLKPPALVRSNFTWEQVQTTNVGVDIGLFNNKLNGSFDWFRRKTLDMLGPGADYPSIVGSAAPLQNAADMLTKGWELQLSWRDKIGDVSYGVGFNISDYKSKITKYNNESGLLGLDSNKKVRYRTGMELGEIWGYEFDRYYTVDDFVEGTLKTTAAGELTGGTLKDGVPKFRGTTPNPGDYMYKHPDANGEIWASSNTADDPGSQRIIGNDSYRYVYGISADASWKGFSLSILLQGVGKRDVWLKNNTMIPYNTNWFIGLFEHQLDYWTPDNANALYPRIYQSAGYNTGTNTQVNDRLLMDASYLDIKSVVLSYDLPKALISKILLDKVTVFVNGENLWSFNHFPEGVHPDSKIRGEGSTYPVMRMFTGGINITF